MRGSVSPSQQQRTDRAAEDSKSGLNRRIMTLKRFLPMGPGRNTTPSSVPRAELDAELVLLSVDAIPSSTSAIALIYAAFAVYHAIVLPTAIRAPALAAYATMIAGALALGFAQARGLSSRRASSLGGIALLLASVATTLLMITLQRDPFSTVYIGLLIIAVGNVILVTRYAVGTIVLVLAAWLLTAGVTLEPEQLVRELALFADRTDVSEEVTRLDAHLVQFEDVIRKERDGPGRRLEFVVQEMGRETNTLGSKAGDVNISRHVVEIKATLEKIRELVQNIE